MENMDTGNAAQVEIAAEKYDAYQQEKPGPGKPAASRNAGHCKAKDQQAEGMELMKVERCLEPSPGIVGGQMGFQTVHTGSTQSDGQRHVEGTKDKEPAGEGGQGVH